MALWAYGAGFAPAGSEAGESRRVLFRGGHTEVESSRVRRGFSLSAESLAAEVIDKPENKAQDHAEQDGGSQGKGEAPSAASPGEIPGETADGDIEPVEADEDDADDDEKEAKRDEDTPDVGHDGSLRGTTPRKNRL
jgi:hypothetical protein